MKRSTGKKSTGKNDSGDKVTTDITTSGDNNTIDRLIPIELWPEYHIWPPVGGLRHIRFYAEEKGATDCFVKKGGRVLVRERKFFDWASCNDIN